VYFSEAFLIFTSNLGIYRLEPTGERVLNVAPSEEFTVVQSKVRAEISRHFKLTLGRPEILNRIGENIIVFDFIRPDVAEEIFSAMLDALLRRCQKRSVSPDSFLGRQRYFAANLPRGLVQRRARYS
jgi:ATP-dependent Clp protease ATP-binding subunit ClpA